MLPYAESLVKIYQPTVDVEGDRTSSYAAPNMISVIKGSQLFREKANRTVPKQPIKLFGTNHKVDC